MDHDSLSRHEALERGVRLELAAARRELARMAEQLDAATDEIEVLTHYRQRVRELEQLSSRLVLTLAELRRDLERAEASRAWRWGHSLTSLAWRARRRQIRTQGALASAIAKIDRLGLPKVALPANEPRTELRRSLADERRVELPLSPARDAAVADYRAALAAEVRGRIGPPPERERWPLVSAIVVTRDGRLLLERLMVGLTDHTDYPNLEVLVVDNGSRDNTRDYLNALSTPFPLSLITTDEDLSFADANNLGVTRSSGEQLLFLNNDVEPFEPGWLRELVAALDTADLNGVGATLLHAEPSGTLAGADPLVQHRGIAFRWEDGTVRGFNLGEGELLWDGPFGTERRCPAVTAACMLITRETFQRLGGFDPIYRFGTEDVDLGLKLSVGGGRMAGIGRSVLVHRESSSQARRDSDFRRLNRAANRRALLERWGPQLWRSYRLARLERDPVWTDGQGPHIAITLTDLDPKAGWGDWYTGHELGDELAALGWRVSYVQRRGDEWYMLPEDLDYVLSLMDPFDLRRVPEHITTIAWIRNWTERWLERPWFGRIDVLLASSRGSAQLIEQSTGRRPISFPLATNPTRFATARPEVEFASDYTYTGNRWGQVRAIEGAIEVRDGERFRAFGLGWQENERMRPYAEGAIPYERLPAVYASAQLVIDDTQGPTLPYGALNARVLDALAAGALPVTDCAAGARELFDEKFPVWSSGAELRAQLDQLLGDQQRREELVRHYRHIVLRKHTYARRAAQLRQILVEHQNRPTFAIKIGAPTRERAANWGDLFYAEALARELQRRGHPTIIQTLDEWEDEAGLRRDVVVHLKGLSRYDPKPGSVNALWSISHPEKLAAEECDAYDLILVASRQFAEKLTKHTATPVLVLEQVTDPHLFKSDPRPEFEHDLAYVANSRNVLRPMMRDLLPTKLDLAVWGANWDGLIPRSYVVGEHLPNEQLRHVYSAAKIVLCDHWDDMRQHGYISNRIFDALACGAFVISDDVKGLREHFGEAVVTYRTRDELHSLIDRFLADPQERRRRGQLGREIVLQRHTFRHAVDVLMGEVLARQQDRPSPRTATAQTR